ncbi:hypothetical protein LSM04_000114 [Trypanosoma melophagium]|nr:hypothetical protein LSM04_000114 [Trypanosoma melophagium]
MEELMAETSALEERVRHREDMQRKKMEFEEVKVEEHLRLLRELEDKQQRILFLHRQQQQQQQQHYQPQIQQEDQNQLYQQQQQQALHQHQGLSPSVSDYYYDPVTLTPHSASSLWRSNNNSSPHQLSSVCQFHHHHNQQQQYHPLQQPQHPRQLQQGSGVYNLPFQSY